MQATPNATLQAAAEYGLAALHLDKARKARAAAEGNANSTLWTALNADVMAAEAWVSVRFAALLSVS